MLSEYTQNMTIAHDLPLGAVVVYRNAETGDKATLVVVQHSRDCDGTPLYMLAQNPIAVPPEDGLTDRYCRYRLHAGWFVGNCDRHLIEDAGERVELREFV